MARKIYFNEYNVLLGKSTYLPLVSGVLHAHALLSPKIKKSCDFQPYIFHLDAPEDILKRYVDPFVAAFSMSMWNEQLSLRVAREVKEKYPDCINTKSNNITFTQKGMLYADELIPSILL